MTEDWVQGRRRRSSCRATAPTTCASRPSSGRRTSSTSCRWPSSTIPAGTEVFVDERFAVPPPALGAGRDGPAAAVRRGAPTTRARDVSAVVAARDDRHLDFAGRGAYQGITRQHAVEMTLPDAAPRSGPLWLVAQGWVHPTDSSINVAIAQGRARAATRPGARGRRRAGPLPRPCAPNLGFPSGKDKTVLIDLAGVFPADGPRRLRLSTNLEIFWDRLALGGRPPRRAP